MFFYKNTYNKFKIYKYSFEYYRLHKINNYNKSKNYFMK